MSTGDIGEYRKNTAGKNKSEQSIETIMPKKLSEASHIKTKAVVVNVPNVYRLVLGSDQ